MIKIASNNKNATKYSFTNFETEFQLANKHKGNKRAVKTTKNKETPSTPNVTLILATGSHNNSTECWNLGVFWLKKIHKNKEITKTKELVKNAKIFITVVSICGKKQIIKEQTIRRKGKKNNKFHIWKYWDLNPKQLACKTKTLPLRYIP